jgi:anti-sigma factor RsiW
MASFLEHLRLRREHRWAPGHMSAYLDGELASRARARLERHAEECPECRGLLYGLRRMLAALQRLAEVGEREAAPDIAAAIGRRLHEPSTR